MGIFSGANQAKFMGKRADIRDYQGAHGVRVRSFSAGVSNGPGKKRFFALEMDVVGSTNSQLSDLISKSGQPAIRSWVALENDYPDYFFSDIKAVLGVVLGKDAQQVTEEDMDAASSEANPHAGKLLCCECMPAGKNDRKNRPIVDCVFSSAESAAA